MPNQKTELNKAIDTIANVVKEIVTRPENVIVKGVESSRVCIFEIIVDDVDRGILIGKQGKTITAIRVLLCPVLGKRLGKRIFIEVAQ